MAMFLNICVFSGMTKYGTLYHYNTEITRESDSYKSQLRPLGSLHQFWCMLSMDG